MTMTERKKPELLAPAGDMECVSAAIRYGADAIYLGGPFMQMRADKVGFTRETLTQASREIHDAGRKLYVTVNCFAFSDEIPQLGEYARFLKSIGTDAIIVSDIGAIAQIREECPELEIHVSTQANCMNWRAAKVYHDMGVKRIVLARELSLEKIAQIRRYSGIKYETPEAVTAGESCALLGLTASWPGLGLGEEPDAAAPLLEPVLSYRVLPAPGEDARQLLQMGVSDIRDALLCCERAPLPREEQDRIAHLMQGRQDDCRLAAQIIGDYLRAFEDVCVSDQERYTLFSPGLTALHLDSQRTQESASMMWYLCKMTGYLSSRMPGNVTVMVEENVDAQILAQFSSLLFDASVCLVAVIRCCPIRTKVTLLPSG